MPYADVSVENTKEIYSANTSSKMATQLLELPFKLFMPIIQQG